jgi:hypothetical protein
MLAKFYRAFHGRPVFGVVMRPNQSNHVGSRIPDKKRFASLRARDHQEGFAEKMRQATKGGSIPTGRGITKSRLF